MNKHIFIDKLTATIGSLIAGKKKFFEKSADSPSFKEHLKSIKLEIPNLTNEGEYEIEATTLVGKLEPALKIAKWCGKNYPTIIYHHGNNEDPFNFSKTAKNTFASIFMRTKEEIPANLIVVRAPFHNKNLKTYQQKMMELKNFTAMIAVSAKVNEEIISTLHNKSNTPVITCGISLGGWVTNIHRSYFNTSTAYIPIFAGALLGDLFLHSEYKKLTSKSALKEPDKMQQNLNFDHDYRKINDKNVYPLLAYYDQFIDYNAQKPCYTEYALDTIEFGHVTGSLQSKIMRQHIVKTMERIMVLYRAHFG